MPAVCGIVSFVLGGTMPASSFMQEYACSCPIQKKRTLAGIDQTVIDTIYASESPDLLYPFRRTSSLRYAMWTEPACISHDCP